MTLRKCEKCNGTNFKICFYEYDCEVEVVCSNCNDKETFTIYDDINKLKGDFNDIQRI